MRRTTVLFALMFAASAAMPALAQAPRQTQEDDYTRYELLAPETASFRIYYDVTATTSGATYFFNTIRKGSEASDEQVYDLMTGQRLTMDVVHGAEAKTQGHPTAAEDTDYIRVTLPRPVPRDGEVRLRIDKTYKDAKSYYREGDLIVFNRPLGIRRNAVVLPKGYELVSLNVPAQVATEADGRIRVSFMHPGPGEAPLIIKARLLPAGVVQRATTKAGPAPRPAGAPQMVPAPAPRSDGSRLGERAHQDREIVYFLQPPETHAFSLYHDYTESREGVDTYVNVVRTGSTVSNPSAYILDTGEPLKQETLKGSQISAAKIDIGEPVSDASEAVVIRFTPVKKGQSVRLRISETYTDPARYRLDGDLLVWDRSFGRPRNTVILPAGWSVTDSSVPVVIDQTADGRTRLYYENPRNDEIDVLVKARRRSQP